MKKVSIIIPCYNQEKYIEDAINSALNQTYKNIEIICIDDCSTDNSSNIIKKFKNIIFIQNEENKGVIKTRNSAIEKANGEYILPLDGDDIIESSYIEKAVKILDENPGIGICYCRARLIDYNGCDMGEWPLPEFNKNGILYVNCIFNCALFRKADFEKIGGYKDYMKEGHEDWDLWLSFLESGFGVYRIDEILFNYRQSNNTRTFDAVKNIEKHYAILFKNHLDLYMKDEDFINKIFFPCKNKEYVRINRKYKKYYKLFQCFLSVSILLFCILIFSIIFLT